MDGVLKVAEMLTQKLAQVAEQYGPAAADVALNVARIEAVSGLVVGGCFLAVALAGWVAFTWVRVNVEDDTDLAALGSITFFGSLALSIVAAINLLNIWNWVGVFEPKLWIARGILKGVL